MNRFGQQVNNDYIKFKLSNEKDKHFKYLIVISSKQLNMQMKKQKKKNQIILIKIQMKPNFRGLSGAQTLANKQQRSCQSD